VDVQDLGLYFIVLSAAVVLNLSISFAPWNLFFLVGAGIGLVVFYSGFRSGNGLDFGSLSSGSSERKLVVEPVDAPSRINEKVRDKEGFKRLNLEKTGRSSTKIHTDTEDVKIDGDTNLMFGIIAQPKRMHTKEYVAYILDLSEDRIRKYDSQTYSTNERLQPFKGKYSWLTARGTDSKGFEDEQEDSGRVNVNVNNTRGENQ